jgi:hypothetical protein
MAWHPVLHLHYSFREEGRETGLLPLDYCRRDLAGDYHITDELLLLLRVPPGDGEEECLTEGK